MVRALLGVLALLLFAGTAQAACPVIPFVFKNGSAFNPTQVNTNFNAIRDCANASTGDVLGPGASAIGNVVTFSDTAGHHVADGGAPATLIVKTNAELKTKSTVGIKALLRNGFTAQGDVAPLMYTASNAPCTINAGLGDDGSQVKSADSRCWIAQFPNSVVDPRQFGCAGDGVTDDTVCFQAAVDAAAYRTLQLVSGHYYCLTAVTINSAMTLAGNNLGVTPPVGSGGIVACAKNASLITVNAGGVVLRGIVLNGTGGNTSGYAMTFNGNDTRLENSLINGFCNYLIVGGSHTVVNGNTFTDNVNPTNSTGCYVITDGTATQQAVGSVYTNNLLTTWGPAAAQTYAAGFLFQNSGGPYISKNDVQRTNYGTIVKPLADKTVSFAFFDSTVLGDTTNADGMLISTTNANSRAEIIKINNSYFGRNGDWPGTFTWASARNLTIETAGGGLITGVHINGTAFNTASNENVAISGSNTTDITIDNSTLCFPGQGTVSSNIAILDVQTVGIRNNTIAAGCNQVIFDDTKTNSNISFVNTGNVGSLQISGNQFYGPWQLGDGPITDTGTAIPNTSLNTIADNYPLDSQPLSVASAASIDPLYYSVVYITGVVNVTDIQHPWQGRKITVYTPGGFTFSTGGTAGTAICANKVMAADAVSVAIYLPVSNCWAIQ